MASQGRDIGRRFWLLWVLAHIVSVILLGFANGPVVAVLQWLILRNHLRRAHLWAVASIGGWLLVEGLLQLFGGIIDLGVIPAAAFSWGISGVAQWLVLRREVHRAGWWIVASIGTGALIAIILLTTSGWATLGFGQVLAVLIAVSIVAGVITGAVMAWLLGQPIPKATKM